MRYRRDKVEIKRYTGEIVVGYYYRLLSTGYYWGNREQLPVGL